MGILGPSLLSNFVVCVVEFVHLDLNLGSKLETQGLNYDTMILNFEWVLNLGGCLI